MLGSGTWRTSCALSCSHSPGFTLAAPVGAAEPRARDLGIPFEWGAPASWNAITDVPGVEVGHVTLIEGEGVRTASPPCFRAARATRRGASASAATSRSTATAR